MRFNSNPTNRISLLGICSGLGQKQKGPELAPQVLRNHGFYEGLAKNGFLLNELEDLKTEQSDDANGWSLIERIRTKAFDSLKNGDVLFSIGGDHSISIGTVQATLMAYPHARVIWIDAHGDINTPQTSLTGNLHGMPIAALLGLFKSPVGGPLLSARQLLIVGVRDLDPAEKQFIEELNIDFVSANEINRHPADALEKIDLWLRKDPRTAIHVSFDVDALDPSVAPATGIRVPMGLSVEFAKNLLSMIVSTDQIIAIDLVELNPMKAESPSELEKTIESIISIFSFVIPKTKNNEYEL